MSALGAVKREEDVDDVYELSSSSTNSDEDKERTKLGKRISPRTSQWEGLQGCVEKKQKVEPVEDPRIIAWTYEELKNHNESVFANRVKHMSPVALPFFPPPTSEAVQFRTSCRQFWKAGDYEGQPAVVRQQAGDLHFLRTPLLGVES